MKICPTVFGPYFWSVVHMTAMSAPDEFDSDKALAYVRFFESLPDILPCSMCGKHLKENLEILPVDTSDLFRWSVDLHNIVNSQINKPEIGYDQAYAYWSSRCERRQDKDRMMILVACIAVAFILMIILSRPK
jgi:hypothetical protein